MKFSKSLVTALLVVVTANTPEVTMACEEIDGIAIQMAQNFGHLTSQLASQFISTVNTQVHKLITAAGSNAITKDGFNALMNSITDGGNYLATTLAGNSQLVNQHELQELVSNLKQVEHAAQRTGASTAHLEQCITQLNAASYHLKARGENMIMATVHGAITNAQQTIDRLVTQVKVSDGHPTAEALSALITGLDGQIDNIAAFVINGLDPITLGLSGAIGSFLLGPIFQSVTDGAEVLIANVVGGAVDIVAGPTLKLFTSSAKKLVAMSKDMKLNINTMQLQQAIKKLDSVADTLPKTLPASGAKATKHAHN